MQIFAGSNQWLQNGIKDAKELHKKITVSRKRIQLMKNHLHKTRVSTIVVA